MKQPIRNLKGEIVDLKDDQSPWWYLSTSTWLLIAGLLVLNAGCFLDASTVDRVFRLLDIRQWPWWYFPIFLVAVALLTRCIIIAVHYPDYDKYERDEAKKFIRLTICLAVTGTIASLSRFFRFGWDMINAFKDWFAHGEFSPSALIVLLIALVLLTIVIYAFTSWLMAYLGRNL